MSATFRLKQAQMELDTYRSFNSSKTLVELRAEIENARSWAIHEAGDFDKSKVLLAKYRSLIDRCTIRAPHDGFVIYANGSFREDDERWRIEPGASVRQGQELFYFPDLSKMEIVAMLGETDVAQVRRGMRSRVRVEGLEGERPLQGHVGEVESLPKRSFKMVDVPHYPCQITLDAAPSLLLPEKSVEVEIQVGRCRDVLAIPSDAVSVDHDSKICCVVGPSGLERREITPGGSSPDLIEVIDGLKEGEIVVLNPTGVLDGSLGRVDPASPGQSDTGTPAASP
jgi:HlyD family secretion protein